MTQEQELIAHIAAIQREEAQRKAMEAEEREHQEAARSVEGARLIADLESLVRPALESAVRALAAQGIQADLGNGTTHGENHPRRSLILESGGESRKLTFEARLNWQEPALTWHTTPGGNGALPAALPAALNAGHITTVIKDFLSRALP